MLRFSDNFFYFVCDHPRAFLPVARKWGIIRAIFRWSNNFLLVFPRAHLKTPLEVALRVLKKNGQDVGNSKQNKRGFCFCFVVVVLFVLFFFFSFLRP